MAMLGSQLLSQHIECYVDSSSSPTLQSASLDKIAELLKNSKVTVESLIIDMEMYLTTSDDILRARGTLLLGEVLGHIVTDWLSDTAVHSLILFFTDRLTDWKALRGALVGCLALLRRRSGGVISENDAKALAVSFLENLQVQALAQYDRKLCFELMECLLQRYSDAIQPLGELLVRGIYDSIYEEKDPQCLVIVFRIVESLVQLFPDPGGPLSSYANDLFSAIGCYFPIHFTHATPEEANVTRDELSKSLMLAFASAPFFEPFAIPLLLEKLSSSLPLAKIESLKFLNYCSSKYGAQSMATHAQALWSSLRDILTDYGASALSSFSPEHLSDSHSNTNEIVRESLLLLETVIIQNTELFLDIFYGDKTMNEALLQTSRYSYIEIPVDVKSKLQVFGWVLDVSSKVSGMVYTSIAGRLLPLVLKMIECSTNDNEIATCLPFGSMFLCVEIVSTYRKLLIKKLSASNTSDSWCIFLQRFHRLFTIFNLKLSTVSHETTADSDTFVAVKGMQMLATFPEECSLTSKLIFEEVLMKFTEVICMDFGRPYLWKLTLQAVTNVGSYLHACNNLEKMKAFANIVVKKIVKLISSSDLSMPLPLKLEALTFISSCGTYCMFETTHALEEVIYINMNNLFINKDVKISNDQVQILNFYLENLIPRIPEDGVPYKNLLDLVLNIWDQIEGCKIITVRLPDKEFTDALTKFMKFAVASCSVEYQNTIVSKAYLILSESTTLLSLDDVELFIPRNLWILSFFSSVIIALRPHAFVPNLRMLLLLFMNTSVKGSVIAAQALGSLLNKINHKHDFVNASGSDVDDAVGMLFDATLECSNADHSRTEKVMSKSIIDAGKTEGANQEHVITALAWIGRGLLMRGHVRVRDIFMAFIEILLSDETYSPSSAINALAYERKHDSLLSVMRCAADAFHILMSDSEICLNRRFHSVIRPLYKQRFFCTVTPIFHSLMIKAESQVKRLMISRAFSHVVCDTPLSAVSSDAKKLIPLLLESLTTLNKDFSDKEIVYGLLLVVSALLTDDNGQQNILEHVRAMIEVIAALVSYPHMMAVRETAIQCLSTLSALPHAIVFRFRNQILQATLKALDDPKRAVRREAVKCRNLWSALSG